MRRTLPIVALSLVLAGCQTWGPTWSEVTGRRYYRTELNRMPTIIERVDGKSELIERGRNATRIEPGRHVLELQGVPPTAGWQGTLQDFELVAEPCKRYYVNAQFEGRVQPSRWAPVIDHVETIAGCSPAGTK